MNVDPYAPPRAPVETTSAHQPFDRLRQHRTCSLCFGLGYLVVVWVAATVAVYGFGVIEQAWGRGGSVQVLVMVGAVMSLVSTIGFGLSAALTQRVAGPGRSAALGLVAAAVTTTSLYLYSFVSGSPTPLAPALIWIAGIGALAPLASPRSVV